ncbi:hypothetical protein MTR67_012883 [Solanum verrucosum]|uniref:Uncharacterized protein n=1 Tax=Solanum verrucosum TaxID=315347 RepID=A0AAF0QAI3_SOLVR|nr:hypothetical protein MTR67_012883 [Solanum verrucosum]
MIRLAPLSEVPTNDEETHPSSSSSSWRNWLKTHFSLIFITKKSDLRILLSVLGCPLFPVSSNPKIPISQVSSSAEYIIEHFTAASGCRKIQGVVKNMYVSGKVSMAIVDASSPASTISQKGCFVLWQMGLDPLAVAAVFSAAEYIGEKNILGIDSFVLKLSANHPDLTERSDNTAEMIKHVVFGYFSQRSGLLVYVEDSYLTRIQSPGSPPTYWETTMGTKVEDYRPVEGVMIAHSGCSSVIITRFGDNLKSGPAITRMEETYTIDDVAFNVPGLSIDSFIPPQGLIKGYPEENLDWRSPID